MTRKQCLDQLADRLKKPSGLSKWVSATTGYIAIYFDQAIRHTSQQHPWTFLRRNYPVSLASGDRVFRLPGEPIDPTDLIRRETATSRDPMEWIEESVGDAIFSPTDTGAPTHVALVMSSATASTAADPQQHAMSYYAKLYPYPNAAFTLKVSGYFYLPYLQGDSEENRWTRDFPMLIMEWVMAWGRWLNDEYEKAREHLALYDKMLASAIDLDNRRRMANIEGLTPSVNADYVPVNNPSTINLWGRGS